MHCAICLNIAKGHSEGTCKRCGALHLVNGYNVCDVHGELMSRHSSIFDALKEVRGR